MSNFSVSIHQLPTASLIASIAGSINDINSIFCDLLGYSKAELVGKSFYSYISLSYKESLGNTLNQKHSGFIDPIDIEFINSNNQLVFLELHISALNHEHEVTFLVQAINLSKHKQIKDELTEHKRFHNTLLHNLPGVVYRCKSDKNWTMEYLSHHCYDLTGYKPEDLVNNNKLSFSDLIHPAHRERIWDKWQNLLVTHEVFIDEYPIITANGTEKWVREQGLGIFNKSNELIALEGIIIDISDRKSVDEQLHFQASLLDQIGDLITATDLNGKIIYVNDAETRLTGKTKEQLLGNMPIIYGENTEKGASQLEILQKTLANGEWRGEVINFNKNGEEVILDSRTWVVRDENGKAIALCGISTDITERKKTEDALRQSEEKFRGLVDNAFDGIYLMRNRRYEYVNNRFSQITGFSPEQLMAEGFDFNALLTEKSKQMVEQRYKDRLEGKSIPNQYELQIRTPQGLTREVEVTTASLGFKGDVVVLGIMRDITERKLTQMLLQENELKLKKQNEEYYALNEELIETNNRIRDINAKLLTANQRAEENDKLKSAFLANMSHEVRTPMNGILGFSQLLLNTDLHEGERGEYVGIIQNCGNQLLAIINDLIDISKIESNQITLSPSEININEILNEQFLLFKPKADSLRLQLSFSMELSNAQSQIIADGTRLRQILSNLLGNAFKFTQKGFVNFGYSLKDGMLEFYVEDSGIGVPPNMLQQIFDRFRQVETDITRIAGGTGLGLAISKALVNKMGGVISVKSELNAGSTFYFTIPYSKSDFKKQEEARLQTNPATSNRKIKILIAEDNEVNFYYLKELLLEVNASLTWVVNGKEAVDLVREQSTFDIVLMDIKMPVMDGYEATREIKKIRKDLPVIAQTAYAMRSDMDMAKEAGCDDYISKPINREDFLNIITKYTK
jgi:PAS domain S-box-containing protein